MAYNLCALLVKYLCKSVVANHNKRVIMFPSILCVFGARIVDVHSAVCKHFRFTICENPSKHPFTFYYTQA